jgi:hypothetical protein
VNEVIKSDSLARSKEGSPRLRRLTGLQHDCLAQRVMAVHQPVVASVEFLDQPCRWHSEEFAAFSPIAALTGKDQVPNAVYIVHGTAFF